MRIKGMLIVLDLTFRGGASLASPEICRILAQFSHMKAGFKDFFFVKMRKHRMADLALFEL